MKRKAIVLITIDTDAKPGSSSTSHDEGQMMDNRTNKFIQTTKFEINIVPSPGDIKDMPLNLRTSLAHELGHVVGYLSKSPITMEDPRSKPMGNRWTADPANAMRAAEREAWDIAEEIDPTIDKEEAKRALGTYDQPELDAQVKLALILDALVGATTNPHTVH
jgi:hypothetical protein